MIDVPCGQCGYCLRRRINDWVIRCKQELKRSPYSYFVTLTFSEVPEVVYQGKVQIGKQEVDGFKYPLQCYFKRLRKYGFKFRYLAIGDYGDTFGRPHYHILFFCDTFCDTDLLHQLWSSPKHQENGFVTVDRISVNRIRYVVEYGLLARLDVDETLKSPPFVVCSKKPAIGSNYLTVEALRYHRKVKAMMRDEGFEYALPRYYKKKIFSYGSSSLHLGIKVQAPDFKEDMVIRTMRQVKALAAHHRKPMEYLIERRESSAASYLNKLRERKKLKNKLLWKKI